MIKEATQKETQNKISLQYFVLYSISDFYGIWLLYVNIFLTGLQHYL